jgi:hygromycin-B 7''-O-kinase
VYFVGQTYVVKLFVPLFAQDFMAEGLVAKHLAGKMAVEIPEVVVEGQIAGWDYLITTHISGASLQSVWDHLSFTDRQQIAEDVGQMIAHIRTIPLSGLDSLGIDWRGFLSTQIADLSAHHPPVPELAWNPKQEFAAFFDSLEGMIDQDFQPVLLLADITREHVFVDRRDGRWQMVGYLDFGDAMIGHPDYEMVAPGLEIGAGNPGLLRSLLLAAGYPENSLDGALCRRLMAYTLIHRYVDLATVLLLMPQAQNAANLEELAQLVWPVIAYTNTTNCENLLVNAKKEPPG